MRLRMTGYGCTDFADQFFTNLLSLFSKLPADERNPIVCRYRFQKNGIAEMIERHSPVLEKIRQQVLLAAEQTIRSVLLMLPNGAHPFLDGERIRPFSYLLELIDANHDVYIHFSSYLFGKIQYFFRRIVFRSNTQRYRIIHIRVGTERDLGRKSGKELLYIVKKQVHLTGSFFQNGRGEINITFTPFSIR